MSFAKVEPNFMIYEIKVILTSKNKLSEEVEWWIDEIKEINFSASSLWNNIFYILFYDFESLICFTYER